MDVGTEVNGIAVDQQSSLVYPTTFGFDWDYFFEDPPGDRLVVYNSNLEQLWYSDDIGNPAGVAVAGGVSYKPALFDFEKTDDVADCVAPDDYFTYTITYGTGSHSHSNVRITDHLPLEVEYYSSDPTGSYDPGSHTVTWQIGSLGAYVEDSVTVTVQVNEQAEPLGTLTNFCEIESDTAYNTTELDTSVCCWNPGVVYVDKHATGRNNGMSWQDAYTNLKHALEKVRTCYADEIWVAEATYSPGEYPYPPDDTFDLVNGVGLYGGFTGSETSRDERDWRANETILTGDRDGEGGSPMAFGSFQGRPAFVYSDRYVLLQTYTITNITANALENLRFYQMLHGHPADEYAAVIYSVYESTIHLLLQQIVMPGPVAKILFI